MQPVVHLLAGAVVALAVACTHIRPSLSSRSTAHPISATTRFYRKGFLMNDLGRVHYEEGGAPEASEDTGGVKWGGEVSQQDEQEERKKEVFYIIFLNKR